MHKDMGHWDSAPLCFLQSGGQALQKRLSWNYCPCHAKKANYPKRKFATQNARPPTKQLADPPCSVRGASSAGATMPVAVAH